ncbi:MAG TPA: hypothetical protein VLW52_17555, partial [Opitutaceae bacterium]|nr:hypothetical protein [Opitutaceae bacterium]
MPRNFFRRVEVLFPLEAPELRRRMLEEILPWEFQDNENARELRASGAYLPVDRRNGEASISAQSGFVDAAGRFEPAAAG